MMPIRFHQYIEETSFFVTFILILPSIMTFKYP